jgi:hypothetical protein
MKKVDKKNEFFNAVFDVHEAVIDLLYARWSGDSGAIAAAKVVLAAAEERFDRLAKELRELDQ